MDRAPSCIQTPQGADIKTQLITAPVFLTPPYYPTLSRPARCPCPRFLPTQYEPRVYHHSMPAPGGGGSGGGSGALMYASLVSYHGGGSQASFKQPSSRLNSSCQVDDHLLAPLPPKRAGTNSCGAGPHSSGAELMSGASVYHPASSASSGSTNAENNPVRRSIRVLERAIAGSKVSIWCLRVLAVLC